MMPEMVSVARTELVRLEERARRSAMDKSYLELVIRLINRVGTASGLENTIDTLLHSILDVIGGTNIVLYYWMDETPYFADGFGKKVQLDRIDDELVQQVIATRQPVEAERPFAETRMLTPEFTTANTWVYPLLVDPDLLGVLKMEGLVHLSMRDLYRCLPTFFAFASLALKNELLGQSRLRQAFDRLSEANARLTLEIVERERVENELREAKEELEQRVAQRTAELRSANERLECELAERKRAEEALLQSSREIQDLYNRAPCGYHSLDVNGRFIQINDTELQWLGYERDEIVGKVRFTDLISDRSLEIFRENFPLFKARGVVRDLEFEMVRKDGSLLPVVLNATAIRDTDGNFLRSRSTIYDVTDRKRAAEDLQRLNEELEQRVDERTAELARKNADLERMNRLFVGRELRMVELKQQIRAMEKKLVEGRP